MFYFPLLVLQLISHCFADRRPSQSSYAKVEAQRPSPEPFAGFVKRVMFLWFDPFAWRGWRKSLDVPDIWDINPDDTSDELVPAFDKYWKQNVAKRERQQERKQKRKPISKEEAAAAGPKSTNGSIVPVLFLAYGVPFYFGGLMKLIVDLLSFANPQILQ